MKRTEAINLEKTISKILRDQGIHTKVEYVRTPDLRFINMEISIKVTKE